MNDSRHQLLPSDLIFVGFNSRVIALNRETGEEVWMWKATSGWSQYVALMLDGDALIVSIQGYMWALDPLTGNELWHNSLKGKGVGIPSMCSVRGSMQSGAVADVEAHDAAASNAAAQ